MIDSDECYRGILFAELLVVIAIISEEVSHFMDRVISTCIDIVIVQLLPSLGNSFLVPNIPQLLVPRFIHWYLHPNRRNWYLIAEY